MKTILTLILLITFNGVAFAEHPEKYIEEGNEEYNDKNFKDAEIKYRKSLQQDPDNKKGKYNLGNSLYKQGNYDEATDRYLELSNSDMSKEQIANIYHNLGNSYLEDKKYEESIDAYKKALKNNPSDKDTKYNLSYALQKLKQQQKQNKNDKNKNDENKEDKDKQDNKNQNKDKDKQNKDKENQNKDNQEKEQQDKDKQKQQNQNKDKSKPQENDKAENNAQQQKENQISKKDAERILQALMNDEKKLQKKLRKLEAKSNSTEKNW